MGRISDSRPGCLSSCSACRSGPWYCRVGSRRVCWSSVMLGSPSLGTFHGFETRLENDRSAGKDPSELGLALLELLDDLTLLLVLHGPFGGPQAGVGVALLVGGE